MLTDSSSEDKAVAHSLSAEVQGLREMMDSLHKARGKTETEHRAQLEAAQGMHMYCMLLYMYIHSYTCS